MTGAFRLRPGTDRAKTGDRVVDAVLIGRGRTARTDQAGTDYGSGRGGHVVTAGSDWLRSCIAAR